MQLHCPGYPSHYFSQNKQDTLEHALFFRNGEYGWKPCANYEHSPENSGKVHCLISFSLPFWIGIKLDSRFSIFTMAKSNKNQNQDF